MSLPFLSIVGPTASGKTAAAFWLADQLLKRHPDRIHGIDIISADSRQVYQGLEIVSGADLPADFQAEQVPIVDPMLEFEVRMWQQGPIKLWGVSCVKPTVEWSLAYFRAMTTQVITTALANKRLVLLVGGTGLYHQLATTADQPLTVGPNEAIRDKAAVLELRELQQWVAKTAAEKWLLMNESDRANPRRLVRVLEIAAAGLGVGVAPSNTSLFPDLNHGWVGLQLTSEELRARIAPRVAARWQAGAVAEVSTLRELMIAEAVPGGYEQVLTTTGVREILSYLDDATDAAAAQAHWLRRELQYAKRQQTWWKKQTQIVWLPALSPTLHQDLLASIEPKLLY